MKLRRTKKNCAIFGPPCILENANYTYLQKLYFNNTNYVLSLIDLFMEIMYYYNVRSLVVHFRIVTRVPVT